MVDKSGDRGGMRWRDVLLDSLVSVGAQRILAAVGGIVTGGFLVASSPEQFLDRRAVRDYVLADGAHVRAIARPDPWTGAQGRETRRRLEAIQREVESLKYRQAADDVHRDEAKGGYSRIRECEQELHVVRSRIDDIRQRLSDLERLIE